MKIAIINQPLNNRGDEAAHRSLVRTINKQFPEAKVKVIFIGADDYAVSQMEVKSPNNEYVSLKTKIKGMRGFIPRQLLKYNILLGAYLFSAYRKFIQTIKQADIIINAPGGICMGGFQSWDHIFLLSLVLKYDKKIIYYSRSIGPFPEKTKNNRIFKRISLGILHKLSFISLRDSKSMKIAAELGISAVPSIDTAFLDVPVVEKLPTELNEILKTDYVVFVPNSLTWHPAYRNADQTTIDKFYISIAQEILSWQGETKIVMLPQTFNSRVNDEAYFHRLAGKINSERIVVLPETYSSDIQQAIIAKSKLVIGARYHSVVFAINNAVPFVSLSYEHKMTGLLEILNLSDRSVAIDMLGKNGYDVSAALKQVSEIAAKTDDIDVAKNKANKIAVEVFKFALIGL
jgi:colanic acid/amylovoran biosynthesis protein